MEYIKILLTFFRIGILSIGGGLATLPFLQDLVNRGWLTGEDLLNLLAVSESTPGPIGINAATYIGNIRLGLIGGLVATIGLVLPSIIIISLISYYLEKFKESSLNQCLLKTIRPLVVGLIAGVTLSLGIDNLISISRLLIFLLMFFIIERKKKHPLVYIILGGLLGFIFKI